MTRLVQTLSVLGLTFAVTFGSGCSSEKPAPQPQSAAKLPASEVAPPEGNTEPPLTDVSDAVNSIPKAGDGAEATPVKVKLISPAEYGDIIAGHKGKVVLVDFWGTWCGPCRKAFPHTIELYEKLSAKGLAVVTVAIDDPESKADVEAFLTSVKAPFDNVQCNLGDNDKSFAAYEIKSEALPHYKLYDRTGKLRKTFDVDAAAGKGIDRAELDAAVEALVAEGQ